MSKRSEKFMIGLMAVSTVHFCFDIFSWIILIPMIQFNSWFYAFLWAMMMASPVWMVSAMMMVTIGSIVSDSKVLSWVTSLMDRVMLEVSPGFIQNIKETYKSTEGSFFLKYVNVEEIFSQMNWNQIARIYELMSPLYDYFPIIYRLLNFSDKLVHSFYQEISRLLSSYPSDTDKHPIMIFARYGYELFSFSIKALGCMMFLNSWVIPLTFLSFSSFIKQSVIDYLFDLGDVRDPSKASSSKINTGNFHLHPQLVKGPIYRSMVFLGADYSIDR